VKALRLARGQPAPTLQDGPAPKRRRGEVLARCVATGIDGTDEGLLGDAGLVLPRGRNALVPLHEACGIVQAADRRASVKEGDLIVPLVRLGCHRCGPCRAGRADLCRTGGYVEAGIKGRDGFAREVWTAPAAFVLKAPSRLGWKAALAEPASISAKGLDEARRVQARIPGHDGLRRALVVGAGSLGALATLLLRTQGVATWVADRHGADHASTRFVQAMGATHLRSDDPDALAAHAGAFDLILETTSVAAVLVQALPTLAPDGVAVLLGVPRHAGVPQPLETSARRLVLQNQAILGSVNSAPAHFRTALRALVQAERKWPGLLERTVTTFTPEQAEDAYLAAGPAVVKKVLRWDLRLQ